ncbi:putative Polypyrimidine tract-binding protein 3 [Paratrimastix pyriformis]|uniref:Polypyrimidine tract-binding protein 3 n=1 Tax=Paratrimastix pyriformis TaxID=342808 RepID=A0ABQ8USK8_9EUKA|nr:putative Polypyrimidine tract-binding protein 3 [Paratrimastix pyriformis]
MQPEPAPTVPTEPTAPQVPSRVLHLRNVTTDISQNDILTLAVPFGTVQHVVLLRAKNQCLLQFQDVASATAMLQYYSQGGRGAPQVPIRGHNIYLQYSAHQELNSAHVGHDSSNQPANRILLISIQNPLYPITVDVLTQVFGPYDPALEKIVIFQKSAGLQALIQFSNIQCATTAKSQLDGKNIYSNCCTLQIQYAKLDHLTVHANTDKTRDFTNPTLPTVPRTPAFQVPQMGMPQGEYGNDKCVLLANGLTERVIPDHLFNIFSGYGNIIRIRILHNKPMALIQFGDNMQANTALTHLKDLRLFGSPIILSYSHFSSISISPNSQSDDGKTKDYQSSPLNRFLRQNPRLMRHMSGPTNTLHVSNMAATITQEAIQAHLSQNAPVVGIRVFEAQGHHQALCQYATVEQATDSLALLHASTLEGSSLPLSRKKNQFPELVLQHDGKGRDRGKDGPETPGDFWRKRGRQRRLISCPRRSHCAVLILISSILGCLLLGFGVVFIIALAPISGFWPVFSMGLVVFLGCYQVWIFFPFLCDTTCRHYRPLFFFSHVPVIAILLSLGVILLAIPSAYRAAVEQEIVHLSSSPTISFTISDPSLALEIVRLVFGALFLLLGLLDLGPLVLCPSIVAPPASAQGLPRGLFWNLSLGSLPVFMCGALFTALGSLFLASTPHIILPLVLLFLGLALMALSLVTCFCRLPCCLVATALLQLVVGLLFLGTGIAFGILPHLLIPAIGAGCGPLLCLDLMGVFLGDTELDSLLAARAADEAGLLLENVTARTDLFLQAHAPATLGAAIIGFFVCGCLFVTTLFTAHAVKLERRRTLHSRHVTAVFNKLHLSAETRHSGLPLPLPPIPPLPPLGTGPVSGPPSEALLESAALTPFPHRLGPGLNAPDSPTALPPASTPAPVAIPTRLSVPRTAARGCRVGSPPALPTISVGGLAGPPSPALALPHPLDTPFAAWRPFAGCPQAALPGTNPDSAGSRSPAFEWPGKDPGSSTTTPTPKMAAHHFALPQNLRIDEHQTFSLYFAFMFIVGLRYNSRQDFKEQRK